MLKTIFNRCRNIALYGHYIPIDYFIFDEQQLVYISIPKVACTSIKIALMAHQEHDKNEYTDYMRIHHNVEAMQYPSLPKRADDYFKFAFVRNPFDRLVSCYEDKVLRSVQHDGRYYFDSAYNKYLIRRLFGTSFSPDMTFQDYVQLVSRIPDWLADAHFKSQYKILFHHGQQIPNYIGHFESIDHDWKLLKQLYNFQPLKHKNPTPLRDWRSYYKNQSIVEIVANRYRDDLLNLGYEETYIELCNAV